MARRPPFQPGVFTAAEISRVADRLYLHRSSRYTWPWYRRTHPLKDTTLRASISISPESLYQFEVARRRLGQSRSAAIAEAMSLAVARMEVRAERARQALLQQLEREMDDDPVIQRYIEDAWRGVCDPDDLAPS